MLDQTSLLPILMSLLSALMFAGTFILVKLGGSGASTLTALWVTLTVNVVFLWSWSLLRFGPQFEQGWQWRYFVIAGLFAPLLGRLFQFIGMARLGANITTPITLTHPLVTIVIAILVLNETVTLPGLIGGVMVLAGSLAVGSQSSDYADLNRLLQHRLLVLFPIAASFSYGISVVFRKIGIGMGTDAVTAAAVTTTTSWLVVTLYALARRQLGSIRCTASELRYFVGAGLMSSLGPVFLFIALRNGSLIIVAPLAATTPLFVLLATWFLLREDELFTGKVIIGTVATVSGVGLLTAFGLA